VRRTKELSRILIALDALEDALHLLPHSAGDAVHPDRVYQGGTWLNLPIRRNDDAVQSELYGGQKGAASRLP
jgi:hypothetical protein